VKPKRLVDFRLRHCRHHGRACGSDSCAAGGIQRPIGSARGSDIALTADDNGQRGQEFRI
jgi:hypothetical protein